MEIVKESPCIRCDRDIPHNRPACPNCGVWQPWGDEAVASARALRARKFFEQEYKAERALLQLRHAPEARAGGEGLRFKVLRWWHLQKIGSGRQVALASLLTFLVTAALSWLVFGGARSSTRRARPLAFQPALQAVTGTRTTVPPSARCNDGTLSYTNSRSGACSGHGGVDMFFAERPESS